MADPFQTHRPGLGHTPAYQVSGYPFVTGSILSAANFATNNAQTVVSFPYVCKSFTIINTTSGSASLRVHFNSIVNTNVINGRHYVTLTGSNTSVTLNNKCKEVYISLNGGSSGDGSFELFADLTNISQIEMISLTGSGLTI